jgi:hypothetical protein
MLKTQGSGKRPVSKPKRLDNQTVKMRSGWRDITMAVRKLSGAGAHVVLTVCHMVFVGCCFHGPVYWGWH